MSSGSRTVEIPIPICKHLLVTE